MSRELRRQVGYGAALLGFVVAFGLAREAAPVAALFALCAGATLVVYIVRSDEVERGLAFKAGAAAFALLLAGATALAALGQSHFIAAAAHEAWAVMIVAFLVCWLALRIRLG